MRTRIYLSKQGRLRESLLDHSSESSIHSIGIRRYCAGSKHTDVRTSGNSRPLCVGTGHCPNTKCQQTTRPLIVGTLTCLPPKYPKSINQNPCEPKPRRHNLETKGAAEIMRGIQSKSPHSFTRAFIPLTPCTLLRLVLQVLAPRN